MKIDSTMTMANDVWKLLQKKLRAPKLKGSVTLGAYSNGRENGYTLKMYAYPPVLTALVVAWSEYRTSDEVVVYVDDRGEWDGIPSDRVYKEKKLFKTVDEAAKYIFLLVKHFCEV